MRAIILAAGKSERLRGTVDNVPKPMVRIKGKPILEHNIEWLRSFGIKDIYINLHYLPDVVKNYFENGDKWAVRISYSYESQLLGTAGAVRKIAEDYWSEELNNTQIERGIERKLKNRSTFLVIYGDNLFEYDLKKIISFHQVKKGIATVAVYEKDDVTQSGVVLIDEDDKIVKFIEKPKSKPKKVVSHLVNTGIYVLELAVLSYIPQNKLSDFGRDIFPEMIKKDEKMFGIIVKGNLTAIDTPKLLREVIERGKNNDYHSHTL